jgi:hypothetical protein
MPPSSNPQADRVFEPGQKVHVYDEYENYMGFDGVIQWFEGEQEGLEMYRVEAPNGNTLILSEMRLDDA